MDRYNGPSREIKAEETEDKDLPADTIIVDSDDEDSELEIETYCESSLVPR